MKQVESGKAFEFGITNEFHSILDDCEMLQNENLDIAKNYFNRISEHEKKKIYVAANKIVVFLIAHDDNILHDCRMIIEMQSDIRGKHGDVRDLVLKNLDKNIETGISVKNRHTAIKHSRLSEKIDFGNQWFGVPVSSNYKSQIAPIFTELKKRQTQRQDWKDIKDKAKKFYIPILDAFKSELTRLYDNNKKEVSKNLLHYLLGKYDFYKIVKENGDISIYSFNISGSLKWGKKIPLPDQIIKIDFKEDSQTTIIIVFNHGWQISFRIHNASTKIEPSLKFDIQIIGWPYQMGKHTMTYG